MMLLKNTDITNATFSAKINKVKKEILNITNLTTTTVFNVKTNEVKNKIPNITDLVKKADYNTKISEIENTVTTDLDHDKYITTQESDKLTSENVTARFKHENLASKNDIANFVKKADLDVKLTNLIKNVLSKKTKHVLAENESEKLQTFDSQVFLLVKIALLYFKSNR